MKTLYLPLKANWYDMIESGVKPEEYREIKSYWMKRICKHYKKGKCTNYCVGCQHIVHVPTDITHVCFSYGYTRRRMTFELESVKAALGNPEWGAPKDEKVFILKLEKKSEMTPPLP